MGIVDMFFVGKLGPSAVASVAMAGTIMGIIIMLGQGVTAGTTALVANAVGRRDQSTAGRVAAQSITITAVFSLLVAAVGIPCAAWVIRALGAEPDVVSPGAAYFRIFCGGSFAMMIMMSFGATLRGAGDALTPLVAMVVGNLVNVVLDPILIFGLLGFPALGVAGSAWATLAGRMVAMLMMVYVFFLGGHRHIRIHLRQLRPDTRLIRRILSIGVFAAGRMFLRNVGGLLLMRLVAAFGTVPVAAYGIGMRLQMLVFGPSMGFGTAASTLVGQNLGARRPDRAARSGWTAMGMAVTVAFALTCIFWAKAPWLMAFFNDDPQVIAVGVSLLRWLSASFVFLSIAFVLGHAMTGAGDTLSPMVITGFTMIVVCVPTAYVLSNLLGRVEGIWMALFVTNLMGGAISAAAFRHGRWKEVGAGITASAEKSVAA
jgi:putative MATE family efflux protein